MSNRSPERPTFIRKLISSLIKKRSIDDSLKQILHNQDAGPDFVFKTSEPAIKPPIRTIAYYLPQFHPIAPNNEAWGQGFTEWTNVTKAVPRFKGHYQPHLPADLGFYDLRLPDTLRAQAELAKLYGVQGFCFHYYFFDGKTVLDTPLLNLMRQKDIDIGFCVNWANESWTRRWDGEDNEIIIAQKYNRESETQLADNLAGFFKDARYIRIKGRPVVLLYRPGALPDGSATILRWRDYFKAEHDEDPFFVMPQAFGVDDPREFGMDAAVGFPPHKVGFEPLKPLQTLSLLDPQFAGAILSYEEMVENAISIKSVGYRLFPGVCPSWDNEARRPGKGKSFFPVSPTLFKRWFTSAVDEVMKFPVKDERLVFVNAWNEWAEGAHLEPDRHFGFAFLEQIRQVLQDVSNNHASS